MLLQRYVTSTIVVQPRPRMRYTFARKPSFGDLSPLTIIAAADPDVDVVLDPLAQDVMWAVTGMISASLVQWVNVSSEYPCLPSTSLSLFRGGVAYRGRERSLRCQILSDWPHIFQSRRLHLGDRHSVQQLIRSVAHTVPTFLRCSGDVGGGRKRKGKR